jgi:hypothetical protein
MVPFKRNPMRKKRTLMQTQKMRKLNLKVCLPSSYAAFIKCPLCHLGKIIQVISTIEEGLKPMKLDSFGQNE